VYKHVVGKPLNRYGATAFLLRSRRNVSPGGPANGTDEASDVAIDGQGSVWVTGKGGNGSSFDFCTIRYQDDGYPATVARYGGSGAGEDAAADGGIYAGTGWSVSQAPAKPVDRDGRW
jgi:hypothetical protein